MSIRSVALVFAVTFVGCSSSSSDGGSSSDGPGSTTNGQPGGPGSPWQPGQPGAGAPTGEGPIAQVAGGRYHTCALLRSGEIYCWGQGAYRQLGGDYGAKHVATRIETVTDAVAIDAGDRFTCAIRKGGAVWCWGDDDHGQAGTAATTPCGDSEIDSVCIVTPQPVVGLESGVVELALGTDHACARRSDGTVACWGDNGSGQVGSTASGDVRQVTAVQGVAGATRLVAGDAHTCALVGSPGKIMCWGANDSGQLGHGAIADDTPGPIPAEVDGLGDAVDLIGGAKHTCAIHGGGKVSCWGYNYLGQLGNGSTKPTRTTALQAVENITDASQLAAGRYHTCARRGGAVSCWGDNSKGQLGNGTTDNQSSPVDVSALSGATFIAATSLSVCAAFGDGHMECWGDDLGAELGDDRVSGDPTTAPVRVKGLP
jgi:alpha-tubulin suppressor-like RCC1 family protein